MSRNLSIDPIMLDTGEFDPDKVYVSIESPEEADVGVAWDGIDLIQQVASTLGLRVSVSTHAGDLDDAP